LEKDLAEWLDQRILDYRVQLKTFEHSQTERDNISKKKEYTRLLEDTIRQQQDFLLLRNIANSKQVKQAYSNEGDPLIYDALRVHSQLRRQVEQSSQQYNEHRVVVQEKLKVLHHMEQETQQLWKQVQRQKEEQFTKNTESLLKKENRVLKCMIEDLLCGSKMDWCEDPRLLHLVSMLQLDR
jgi:type I site-specific restriction endonuclease